MEIFRSSPIGGHGDDASVESVVSTVWLGAYYGSAFARGQLEKKLAVALAPAVLVQQSFREISAILSQLVRAGSAPWPASAPPEGTRAGPDVGLPKFGDVRG